jgi:hypothetical protein
MAALTPAAGNLQRLRIESVAAANRVEIVCDQCTADKKCLSSRGLLSALLLQLDGTFMGLPVAGNAIQNLVGAFAAGTESVWASHRLLLK